MTEPPSRGEAHKHEEDTDSKLSLFTKWYTVHSECEACAGAWPIPWHLLGWYKDAPFSLPLLFLPLLPVNQTGVKRRLISPLSGWQCLGDRPVVANWMVLCPLSSCIHPSHISLTWIPLSSPLLSPLSSRLYQPFFTFFSKHSPPPSPLPCLHLSQPSAIPPWPISSLPTLLTLSSSPLSGAEPPEGTH